jgi:hypothetical protein
MRFLDSILKVKLNLTFSEKEGEAVKQHMLYFNAFLNNMEETFQPKYLISQVQQNSSGQLAGIMLPPVRQFNLSLNLLAENDDQSWNNYRKIQIIKAFMFTQGDSVQALSDAMIYGKTDELSKKTNSENSGAKIHFPPITNEKEEGFIFTAFSYKPIDEFGYVVYAMKNGKETLIPKAGVLTIGGMLNSSQKFAPITIGAPPRRNIRNEIRIIEPPAAGTTDAAAAAGGEVPDVTP